MSMTAKTPDAAMSMHFCCGDGSAKALLPAGPKMPTSMIAILICAVVMPGALPGGEVQPRWATEPGATDALVTAPSAVPLATERPATPGPGTPGTPSAPGAAVP